MNTCLVCAEPHNRAREACISCGTATATMTAIIAASGRHRFLFGRARAEKPEPDVPVSAPKPRAARPPVRQTRPRKPALREPPPVREQEIFSDEDPVLHIDRRAPRKGYKNLIEGAPVVLITDVVLCLLLDFFVLQLVSRLSQRDLIPLVNYSLIPLFFVLLTFTVLYFAIFKMIFGRTLGEILIDALKTRDRG